MQNNNWIWKLHAPSENNNKLYWLQHYHKTSSICQDRLADDHTWESIIIADFLIFNDNN